MQVSVARPATTDKIVFLMFMNQSWSAEAPSQETTNTEGTTKLSRAKDDSTISHPAKTSLVGRRKVKDLGSDDNGKIAR
ncbi:MAG: hypothetical protein DMF00_06470 [Verrucomicrobia bacterium]|nr:MAG: hypothetical protein DMF00_06470 [Verrucomicrobiota bacterium]